jgi:hypothetical protein
VDGDGLGDLCDSDADNDGIPNGSDLCSLVYNPQQNDADLDGLGNACDPDDDNDGVLDGADNCPLVSNPSQNAVNDLECDSDTDGDGVPDSVDNCVATRNFEQFDMDSDLIGDLCDGDTDGDGINNIQDNCPRKANGNLLDSDRDGMGDACDDRYCFVVNRADPDHCLDPNNTFTVLSLPTDAAEIGESKRLHIFANRTNQAMRYTWTVISRPDNSDAKIANPRGSVHVSDAFEYRYLSDQIANFTPDVAGKYELQLSAELVFPDDQYPQNTTSRTTFALTVSEGDESGGCVCAAPSQKSFGASWLLVLASGLVFAVRRRK